MSKVRIGIIISTEMDNKIVSNARSALSVRNVLAYVRENIEPHLPEGDAIQVYVIEINGDNTPKEIIRECES